MVVEVVPERLDVRDDIRHALRREMAGEEHCSDKSAHHTVSKHPRTVGQETYQR